MIVVGAYILFSGAERCYTALKKQVEANCEKTSKMTVAAEIIYMILQEQVKIDREGTDKNKIAVVVMVSYGEIAKKVQG